MQGQLFGDAQKVIGELNGSIDTVAADAGNVTVIDPSDFAGHEICTHNPEWIFAPKVSVKMSAGGKSASFGVAGADSTCVDEVSPVPPETVHVFEAGKVKVDVEIALNCMPHPTTHGQQALASDFMQGM